jgi:hypothetical protein
MSDGIVALVAYVFSRWTCSYCGIYERGTNIGQQPLRTCPSCGRDAEMSHAIQGMTARALPYHTLPRVESEDQTAMRYRHLKNMAKRKQSSDDTYTTKVANHRSGRSTGRPRKKKKGDLNAVGA